MKHECQLSNSGEDITKLFPSDSKLTLLMRRMQYYITVSPKNPRTRRVFRSFAAVAAERKRHMKHICIIHPFSMLRMQWEGLMAVVLLIQMVVVPIHVTYNNDPKYQRKYLTFFVCFLNVFSIVDIMLNFCTGYYNSDKSEVVLTWVKVVLCYLRFYFIFDLLGSLSIVFRYETLLPIFSESTVKLMNMVQLCRLFRVFTALQYLDQLYDRLEVSRAIRNTNKSVLSSAMLLHWLTCTNYLVADAVQCLEKCNISKDSWIYEVHNSTGRKLADEYVKSLSRCVSFAFHTSAGTAKPKSTEDIIISIVNLLGGFVILLLFLIQLKQLSKTVGASKVKYRAMINSLQEYMSHKQLPSSLQHQLIAYYDFRFQSSYFKETEILSCTSGQLRQEIMLHSCRRLVENVTFFNNLPTALLVRIVACLRIEIFMANEVILKVGTPGDSMYFIAAGTVSIYSPGGLEVCHLGDGAHFGEIALVMEDALRVASVVAIETSELFRLDRLSFQRVIEPYPDLLARIEQIALERLELTRVLDERNRRVIESMGEHTVNRKSARLIKTV